MMGRCILIFCAILVVLSAPNDYFTQQDSEQIQTLIKGKQSKSTGAFNDNLKDTFFAVEALKYLGSKTPNEKDVCKFAKAEMKDKIENIFYAVSIVETLNCGESLSKSPVNEKIHSALKSKNLYDVVYAIGTVSNLLPKKHIDSLNPSDVTTALRTIGDLLDPEYGTWFSEENQEEGSPYLAGLALSALSQLIPFMSDTTELSAIIDAIPALMLNADENDESMIIFRHTDNNISSLKATAFLMKGLSDLALSSKLKLEVQDEQVEGIATFIVSQKFVSSIEDSHALLVGLHAVNSRAFKRPLVISLVNSQIHATKEKGKETEIKVVVTDVWGKETGKNKVFLVRAYRSSKSDTPLLSNQEVPIVSGEKNLYALDFLAARPDPGSYVLEFRVIPQEKEDQFQTITSALRRVQVVAEVKMSDGTISISEHESRDFAGKPITFLEGQTLPNVVELGPRAHLILAFKLKNTASGRSVSVHQTFAKFTNKETRKSAYFVIPHSTVQGMQSYELNLDVAKNAAKFDHVSGIYELELLLGDSYVVNSIHWVVVKVKITFDGTPKSKDVTFDPFKPLPVIEHMFRPAEKRAPEIITYIFTILVILPIFVFLVGILRSGANLGNYPGGKAAPMALVFLAGLGSMLALIFYYWLNLNLFEALWYGSVLAIPTIFSGNVVLGYFAKQRTSSKIKPE